jgi:hypothetical protein
MRHFLETGTLLGMALTGWKKGVFRPVFGNFSQGVDVGFWLRIMRASFAVPAVLDREEKLTQNC